MLVRVALTVSAFLIFLFLLFPEILEDRSLIVVFGFGMGALAGVIAIVYALYNLAIPREFVCELTRQELRCICPLEGISESFEVKINQIDKIELRSLGEGHSWYIWDTAGNSYSLIENYGNPATRFVKLILEMNPNIEEIHT